MKGTYRRGSSKETATIGREIGRGGEGQVYTLKEDADEVGKIYYDNEDTEIQRQKVVHFAAMNESELLREIAAWPTDYLVNNEGDCVGFTMDFLKGWQPLFSSYQIRSRMRRFPDAGFSFLVRAARNLSACVHRVHEAGLVIGDLNESNTLIDGRAMVKLIDTDSFQVEIDGYVLTCGVAKTELLAPELHNRSLDDFVRQPEHDLFSLAVLVFQILVLGRHPYVGRQREGVEQTLETSIQRGDYAFSELRETQVDPPPGLGITWLPPNLKSMFERSFSTDKKARPSAQTWYDALHELEGQIVQCKTNPAHEYWKGVDACPWCDLEKKWRVTLFGASTEKPEELVDATEEIEEIWERIERLPSPAAIALPKPPSTEGVEPAKLSVLQRIGGLFVSTQYLWLMLYLPLLVLFRAAARPLPRQHGLAALSAGCWRGWTWLSAWHGFPAAPETDERRNAGDHGRIRCARQPVAADGGCRLVPEPTGQCSRHV